MLNEPVAEASCIAFKCRLSVNMNYCSNDTMDMKDLLFVLFFSEFLFVCVAVAVAIAATADGGKWRK